MLPPQRSMSNADLSALTPRQLSAHLDSFVVGQAKAKKVLAVAVYNHYKILRHIQSTRIPPPPPPEVDALSSSFDHLTDPTRPHVPLGPDGLPAALANPHTLPFSFQPSYVPQPQKRGRKPAATTTTTTPPEDPTLYDSSPPPPTTKRASKKQQAAKAGSTEPWVGASTPAEDQAILSDFQGQVQGTPLAPSSPPPQPTYDPDALVYEKSNVLLLGPTGSGKSLLARTLAKCLDVPFVGVEATGMTSAGYVGEDVESCVARLLVAADWDVERASHGIIFIDEVDKISRSAASYSAKDVSGEGVQQALLKLLEGTVVSVPDKDEKMGRGRPPHLVDTTNILFILAGAFVGLDKIITKRIEKGSIGFGAQLAGSLAAKSTPPDYFTSTNPEKAVPDVLEQVEPVDLVQFGFIPEFIGRLPIFATLRALSIADLLRVLTEPKNALVKQYEELFKAHDVEIRFTTSALEEVAKAAVGKGTGARGLRRIMEQTLLESMYATPASSVRYVLVDRDVVLGAKPATFYSRSQHSTFLSEYEAEENGAPQEENPEEVDYTEQVEQVLERRRAAA
ncbi:hypothetical protein MNV49_007435 [Pseudohyphozyma bogoriensis]|nr:hypothetical protein MNV49_007435 [Pseudohyphozyma bogoriensis]